MSLPPFQVIILVAAGSLVLGSGATWLYMRIHQLLAEIAALTERLAKLEAASRKRMPYEAMDELLDAMAVLDRMRDGRALEEALQLDGTAPTPRGGPASGSICYRE